VRLIPFEQVWNCFWSSIKKHYFVFEDHKTAVVYFYNDETYDFVGPVYDSGPRFKKEDCIKRYAIVNKEVVVNDNGRLYSITKTSNLH
jgi:hypothetical protein